MLVLQTFVGAQKNLTCFSEIFMSDADVQVMEKEFETPLGHEDDVNAVSFVDSATHVLASGGDDGLCKIWDRRSLR